MTKASPEFGTGSSESAAANEPAASERPRSAPAAGAPALHAELRNASAQTLLRRMQEILARYFSVGAAAGDLRERQQSVMKLKYACDQHAPTIKSSPDAPQGA